MFFYQNGPALIATFKTTNTAIQEVTLVPSNRINGFEWEIVGESSEQLIDLIGQWVESYCNKQQPTVLLPIPLEEVTPYTFHVLKTLQRVPFGEQLTYQQLAVKTGNPKAARAVGSACGRNPCLLVIPCHRVLAHGGKLGGFSAGLEIKKILLAFESLA